MASWPRRAFLPQSVSIQVGCGCREPAGGLPSLGAESWGLLTDLGAGRRSAMWMCVFLLPLVIVWLLPILVSDGRGQVASAS